MLPPSRHWQDLTTADFATLDPERTVALWPLGAIEQHGPHLPVSVDAAIAADLTRRALALLPRDVPVLVLPTSIFGRSEEHRDFAGTLGVSAGTLRALWFEIGAGVARAGLRKLVMLNAHGGNVQVMQIVSRELRIAHRLFVVGASWPQLGFPPGLVDLDERLFGIHAGEIETSMMLEVDGGHVRMERAKDFVPLARTSRGEFPAIMALGAAGFGWQIQDLNMEGACGQAGRAKVETGRAILDHVARGLVELLEEVSRYPLSNLRDGPRATSRTEVAG